MTSAEYAALLERPEWRVRRLEILERDGFRCRRCGLAGVVLHVHHQRYLRGRKPWDYPYDYLVTLCAACHSMVHEFQFIENLDRTDPAGKEMRAELRGMVGAVAKLMEPEPQRPMQSEPTYDADRVWRWVRQLPESRSHRPMMKFAGWLWNTGVRDMGILMAILDDRCRVNPDVAFAYYAPGSEARAGIEARFNIARGEAENTEHKRADNEFLGTLRQAT